MGIWSGLQYKYEILPVEPSSYQWDLMHSYNIQVSIEQMVKPFHEGHKPSVRWLVLDEIIVAFSILEDFIVPSHIK